MQERNNVLSPECEAELSCWDMHSVSQEGTNIVDIRDDEEGFLVVRVTATISAYDLKSLLRYGQKAMNRGLEFGEKSLAARMRSLLNVAEKA